MSLSTDRQIPQLPKRLPAGSVYVVEGRVGQHGRLRVSSRFVVMPGGAKLEFPLEPASVELARIESIGGGSRRSIGCRIRPGSRMNRFSRAAKKIALVTGTRHQK